MEEEAGWDWKPSFAKRKNKNKNKTGGYSPMEVFGPVSRDLRKENGLCLAPTAFPVNEGRRGYSTLLVSLLTGDPEKGARGRWGKHLKRS